MASMFAAGRVGGRRGCVLLVQIAQGRCAGFLLRQATRYCTTLSKKTLTPRLTPSWQARSLHTYHKGLMSDKDEGEFTPKATQPVSDETEEQGFFTGFNGICQNCRRYGHMNRQCPFPAVCNNCLNEGHQAWECTNDPVCHNCKQIGHMGRDCTRTVVCERCGMEGHTWINCGNKFRKWW